MLYANCMAAHGAAPGYGAPPPGGMQGYRAPPAGAPGYGGPSPGYGGGPGYGAPPPGTPLPPPGY
jgi:hypothetical protein